MSGQISNASKAAMVVGVGCYVGFLAKGFVPEKFEKLVRRREERREEMQQRKKLSEEEAITQQIDRHNIQISEEYKKNVQLAEDNDQSSYEYFVDTEKDKTLTEGVNVDVKQVLAKPLSEEDSDIKL